MSSACWELGRYSEAIEITELDLRQNPNSLPGKKGLAYIYLKSGRFAEAIPMHRHAIEAHSGAAYLRGQLAEACLGVEDIVAAAEQQHCYFSFTPRLRKKYASASEKGEAAADLGQGSKLPG